MSNSNSGENSPTEIKDTKTQTKKAASYTYWVNNDPNFFGGKEPVHTGPTKLDSAEAEKLKQYIF
jgi:hypothetical protein